jgi:primosomal protein N' (replication factor Y) (superfamily II helicase)
MCQENRFAEVILPVPLPGLFTYLIPEHLHGLVIPGKRVAVSFGKRRIMAGVVRRLRNTTDLASSPKEIIDILDEIPLIRESHFVFWEWMSRYYLCTLGEIMIAALPASFRLESETSVFLDPAFEGGMEMLTDKEYLVCEALRYTPALTISQITEIVDQKKVINLIQGLIHKGVIIASESLHDSYKPRTITMLRLREAWQPEENLQTLLNDLLGRAYRQMEVMMCFLQDAGENPASAQVSRQQLMQQSGASPAVLKAIIDKGILEEVQVEVSRIQTFEANKSVAEIALNDLQQQALEQIKAGFEAGKTVLLHGVTGSGKTEVFIKLIDEVVRSGKQVLYLLPEIALTSQIINRLRAYFGNKVQVFHSRYSDAERTELWNKIVRFTGDDNDPFVIVGARSSIFLPLTDIGLLIVDEEHDHSFKQYDPAPRYQARDAAVMLAMQLHVPVLLGSATPAIESFHNVKTGKYHLAELPERYGESMMPEMMIADVAEATRRKEMHSHYTPLLIQQTRKALAEHRQIILFQNRRGFSLRVYCTSCGWHPGCPHCDVTLTYHKFIDKLKCHYCGHMQKLPTVCTDCGSKEIRTSGFGTEKIEEEIAVLFPGAKVHRMDLDTTRTKNAYQNIIRDFEDRKIDILIGTQMVSKGLDFSNVGVVGVMNADSMIAFPDFRSFERSFQHIVQVSGRAGRKATRGFVVIQTSRPSHDVIRLARNHDYEGLYRLQIAERQQFEYPPFTRLVRIVCKSKEASSLNEASFMLASLLRTRLGCPVLGPEYPLVSKIKDQLIRHILIKLKTDQHLTARKTLLQELVFKVQERPDFRKVRFVIDVDPY